MAIAIALEYLNDNSDFINITWCADDVLSVAERRGLKLSKDQCLEVLNYLDSNHDGDYGISWLTIECAQDSLNSAVE